jgi:GGDEF domain-containing protein
VAPSFATALALIHRNYKQVVERINDATMDGLALRIGAGVAVFPEDGDGSDALFSAADARMYRCKRGWSVHAS